MVGGMASVFTCPWLEGISIAALYYFLSFSLSPLYLHLSVRPCSTTYDDDTPDIRKAGRLSLGSVR